MCVQNLQLDLIILSHSEYYSDAWLISQPAGLLSVIYGQYKWVISSFTTQERCQID